MTFRQFVLAVRSAYAAKDEFERGDKQKALSEAKRARDLLNQIIEGLENENNMEV